MKLLATAALLLLGALCITAAPTIEEIDDDVARLRVKTTLETVEAILLEGVADDEEESKHKYVSALGKTIDQECVFGQYKKYHYTHDLLEEDLLKSKLQQFSSDYDLGLIRFGVVAASCSNKIDPILKFIFDILFASGELMDAFRDDPPFSLAFDDVNCYTNYAISHGLVDQKVYNFLNQTLVNQTVEECYKEVDENLDSVKMLIAMLEEDGTIDKAAIECIQNQLFEIIKKIVFKYSLLFSASVTLEQKAQERVNFVKDIKTTIEKIAFCDAISKFTGIDETPQV